MASDDIVLLQQLLKCHLRMQVLQDCRETSTCRIHCREQGETRRLWACHHISNMRWNIHRRLEQQQLSAPTCVSQCSASAGMGERICSASGCILLACRPGLGNLPTSAAQQPAGQGRFGGNFGGQMPQVGITIAWRLFQSVAVVLVLRYCDLRSFGDAQQVTAPLLADAQYMSCEGCRLTRKHCCVQFAPQAGRGGVPVIMNGLPGNAARGAVGSNVGINIGAGRPGMERGGPAGAQMGQPTANAGMQRGGANLNAIFLNNQASSLDLFVIMLRHT